MRVTDAVLAAERHDGSVRPPGPGLRLTLTTACSVCDRRNTKHASYPFAPHTVRGGTAARVVDYLVGAAAPERGQFCEHCGVMGRVRPQVAGELRADTAGFLTEKVLQRAADALGLTVKRDGGWARAPSPDDREYTYDTFVPAAGRDAPDAVEIARRQNRGTPVWRVALTDGTGTEQVG